MRKKKMQIFLNPSWVLEWDPRFPSSQLPANPTPERLLEFFCSLGKRSDMAAFRKRYFKVSEEERRLDISVEEPEIKENLFVPLRQAKTNYILGDYVGSIALCGIVAEKLAILIHNMSKPDEARREKFEKKWGQSERVKELKRRKLIDEQCTNDFEDIMKYRKSALHHWNTVEGRTAERAAQAYAAATRLVDATTEFKIEAGVLTMNPKLWEYLEGKGWIEDDKAGE